jgi:hypothetical protein
MPDISVLLMLSYLGAMFLRIQFLWTVTGILAVLSIITNGMVFLATFSLMPLINVIFCCLIASQAAAQARGIDVIGWIRRKFGGRR